MQILTEAMKLFTGVTPLFTAAIPVILLYMKQRMDKKTAEKNRTERDDKQDAALAVIATKLEVVAKYMDKTEGVIKDTQEHLKNECLKKALFTKLTYTAFNFVNTRPELSHSMKTLLFSGQDEVYKLGKLLLFNRSIKPSNLDAMVISIIGRLKVPAKTVEDLFYSKLKEDTRSRTLIEAFKQRVEEDVLSGKYNGKTGEQAIDIIATFMIDLFTRAVTIYNKKDIYGDQDIRFAVSSK